MKSTMLYFGYVVDFKEILYKGLSFGAWILSEKPARWECPLGRSGADAAALLNLASQLATEPTGKAPITKPARPMAVRMKRSTAKKGTTQAPMDN